MSTFQEILDEVTWQIARPDLGARVEFATLRGLHRCHSLGFFSKDIRRVPILEGTYNIGAYVDSPTNLIAEIPVGTDPAFADYETKAYKFRAVERISLYSDAAMQTLVFDEFKDRAVDPLYDDFKRMFANYYQRNGTNLRINFGETPDYAELSYFALPLGLTDALPSSLDDSFIVRDYPDICVSAAIIAIAPVAGLSDLAAEHKSLWPTLLDNLLTNEPTVK